MRTKIDYDMNDTIVTRKSLRQTTTLSEKYAVQS